MTHVFVSPHPDDAALSCGGLIASLRELGQNVTILSVFSGGPRDGEALSDYQRAALGFGSKAIWPNTEAFRRDNIGADVPLGREDAPWSADPERIAVTQERANTQARQFWQRAAWTRSANVTNVETLERPLADSVGGQGSDEELDLGAADAMAVRRVEDERYAFFIEASLISLELPDAVFRGYQGDTELLGGVRADDPAPFDILRREILRLEPQQVYVPLAVGGHVDHQLCREAGLALLEEERSWVMPGPDLVGRVSFYEDFPYALWNGFRSPADLPGEWLQLPPGVDLSAGYADIGDQMERKAAGLRLYASQMPHLFESDQGMLDALAGYHARVAREGGVPGFAERYWTPTRP
ncbi:MAG: PIG-L deacetylase family protein [Candidatus Limnocylindrales bacterium]